MNLYTTCATDKVTELHLSQMVVHKVIKKFTLIFDPALYTLVIIIIIIIIVIIIIVKFSSWLLLC